MMILCIYSKTSDEQHTMVQSKKLKVFFLTLRWQAGMGFDQLQGGDNIAYVKFIRWSIKASDEQHTIAPAKQKVIGVFPHLKAAGRHGF